MKEIEDRAEFNIQEQLRFIADAQEDGLEVSLYLSTLDDSPVGSDQGLAWGVMHLPALDIKRVTRRDAAFLMVPKRDVSLPLTHVFAMQAREEGGRNRTLVTLDTPAQYSAAADMFNNTGVRNLVGIAADLPRQEPHPSHVEALPALRRSAFRVLKGGAE
jgi:hypothetical protein